MMTESDNPESDNRIDFQGEALLTSEKQATSLTISCFIFDVAELPRGPEIERTWLNS